MKPNIHYWNNKPTNKKAISKESVFKRDVRASNTYAKRPTRQTPSLPRLKCQDDKSCD